MPSLMSPLEQANGHAANLYWLAFLLTGHREASVDMAVEALDSPDEALRFIGRSCRPVDMAVEALNSPDPDLACGLPCTGDVDMAVEALNSPDGNPFFSAWMLAWSRKVVIAKALGAIRQELAESASRMATVRRRNCARPPRQWALRPDTTKVQLECALLAIDVFPRCVLLLSVFEGLSIDDTTVLLDGDRELVRKAQACAIEELTRNLARIERPASPAPASSGSMLEPSLA